MQNFEKNVQETIDWAIRTYGFEVAFKKAEENFSGLVLEHLNHMIALKNKIENDEMLKTRIVDEMFSAYNENRTPKFM